jgi:c-di-GMP-binding flagellar brake protein YcgR
VRLTHFPESALKRLIGKAVIFKNSENMIYPGYYSSFDAAHNSFIALNVRQSAQGLWLPNRIHLKSHVLAIPVDELGLIIDVLVSTEEMIILVNEQFVRVCTRFVDLLVPFVVNS